MAPKKVMKTMKKKDVEKSKDLEKSKGSKKDLEKSKGSKKGLGKPMKTLDKNKLNKTNLEKLGQVSLADKMKQAAEVSETTEEAALVLYNSLSKDEKAKAWSKHQTALKRKSEEEKAEHEALSKKDKGLAAAAHLLEKEGKQYVVALKKASHSENLKQKDKWESELEMLQKWTHQELELHIQSGRIRWQECPGTRGVYEYKDTQNWERELSWKRQNEFQQGKEHDPEDQDLEKFMEVFGVEWSSLSLDDKPKGFGKGKGKGLGKDQVKGNSKAKKGQKEKPGKVNIQDETDLAKVLGACKKAKNMVSSSKDDLEMALEKAKKKLSKDGMKDANSLLQELGKAQDELKACISSKKPGVTKIKESLMSVAKTIKAAKDETKELNQLANKANSAACSRSGK